MKKEISRKQFLAIGFGAFGAAIASCSSGGGRGGSGGNAAGSDGNGGSSAGAGGGESKTGGTSGSKTGGTSGKTGGTSGTGGSGGSGGSGTGGTGTGGSGTGGSKTGGAGGTSSGGTGGTSAANMCSAKIVATISGNHEPGPHALEIPMTDITAGATKCYNAKGASGHNHYVTVTAANFTTLKGGGVVKVFSCNGGDHEFVLSCVAGAPAPAAPVCPTEIPGSVACAA